MSKRIKNYLHLYLGCECIHTNKEGGETRFQLNAYNLNQYESWSNDVKPLLFPLSSITQEECDEYNRKQSTLFSLYDFHNQVIQEAECTRYLLALHFDLFNLIDAGLAIDATAIKKEGAK